MTQSTDTPSPFLLRRLAAMLYDTLLVLPLIMLSVAVAMGTSRLLTGGDTGNALDPNLVRVIALFTTIAFFCAFWVKSGQTLGMQAWRIKLVDFEGRVPGLARCVVRCLAAVLSATCFGLGYLWCLVDRRRRYWHDYLSGTEFILVPKPEKKKKTKTPA
jgi:uncharacterized RDD family membrane protein YckC